MKAAVPRAAPTWVAELANPEARPACAPGAAKAISMVVGEAEGHSRRDHEQPRQHGSRIAGPLRCVPKPQLTGGQDDKTEHEAPPRPEVAEAAGEQGERDEKPGERHRNHGHPAALRRHRECLLKIEGNQDEGGGSGGSAEDRERDPRRQDTRAKHLE